jgi:dihydroorotate dehydrogenase (NAD+) catalytic subunit
MWLAEESPIRKQDLVLEKPFVNASGILGFAPDPRGMPFLDRMGAFITNPISRTPRQPAGNRCCLPFAGGFLLHTGLPNPGISHAIRQNQRRWASAPLPVIVHLLVERPESLAEMVRKLEALENILAMELGLPPDCTQEQLLDFATAASGELPVVICLSPEQIPILLPTLKELQPVGVHLTSPRGTLPGPDGELVAGRLYGPAIFPVMLSAVRILMNAEMQVIVDGGVMEQEQANTLLDCGVIAVGLGGILWGVELEAVFSSKR